MDVWTAVDGEGGGPVQPRELVVGTRPSPLALWQARWVMEQLEAAARRHALPLRMTLREIRTEGDLDRETPLARFGQRGVFVRAVEQALRRGEVDVAVHSLKDLPGEQPPDLVLAAYPIRDDARDVAVVNRPGGGPDTPDPGRSPAAGAVARPLPFLPPGARVGTGSPRRIAHLRHWRPDLVFVPIRGNVDTRLRKLESGGLDAIVLAAAGLRRLGLWDDRVQPLAPEHCLPAPGQGALAVQVRAADNQARAVVSLIDDPHVRVAVTAERELLARLGGGCHVPIGALAVWEGDGAERRLHLQASVADPEGTRLIVAGFHRPAPALLQKPDPPLGPGEERTAAGAWEEAVVAAEAAARELARAVAERLLAQGAGELLARRTP